MFSHFMSFFQKNTTFSDIIIETRYILKKNSPKICFTCLKIPKTSPTITELEGDPSIVATKR